MSDKLAPGNHRMGLMTEHRLPPKEQEQVWCLFCKLTSFADLPAENRMELFLSEILDLMTEAYLAGKLGMTH